MPLALALALKAAAAAAAAAAADARTKQALQAQADMQVSLVEAKKEAAASKAEAAAATKKLDILDRKRALGDTDFAILETESLDDNPEALKHKYAHNSSHVTCHTPHVTRHVSPGWKFCFVPVPKTASALPERSRRSKRAPRRRLGLVIN
jgi:hypothetical protein